MSEEGLISVKPVSHKEVLKGNSVELYCLPRSSDPEVELVWYKDGVILDKSMSSMTTVGRGEVLNIPMNVTGTFTCVVSSENESKNASSTVVIVGKYPICLQYV